MVRNATDLVPTMAKTLTNGRWKLIFSARSKHVGYGSDRSNA